MVLVDLSEKHLHMLQAESAISPEVIDRRGYRTVTTRAELLRLGFSQAQAQVPALLVPIWGVTGEITLYQVRPDVPRIHYGKAIKYESPKGSKMALDVHPSVRHMLGDPREPLWITEGVKKGDALVSRGCCAVALLGVWNWRGSNGQGGKVALPDWESIALNGRRIYICFDSDIMTKPGVYQALVRLKAFLERRG